MDTPLAGTGVSGSQVGGHVRSHVSTHPCWARWCRCGDRRVGLPVLNKDLQFPSIALNSSK